MRDRIAAAGRDPDGLQVVANLRVHKTDDGTIDVDRTLAPVAASRRRRRHRLPHPVPVAAPDAAFESELTELVTAFRAAVGRVGP